jgi:cardiolipin synthase
MAPELVQGFSLRTLLGWVRQPRPRVAGAAVAPRRRRWPWWVALAVAITAAGLMIAQDQETLIVQSPIAADDPRYPAYVGSLVGAPVVRGDRIDVLRNGDGAFPPMLAAIEEARERIAFESFIFEKGVVADQFADAMVRAAQRGVQVRIVLDGFGASGLDEVEQRLTDGGVQILWFNGVRPWTLEEANYRTHRKVLVVDGRVGFTGGMGIADHWQGDAQDEDHWRDTQFRIEGPSVRALEASFYENWLESGGREAPVLDEPPPVMDRTARSIVIWSNPTGGASNVKLLYLLAIAAATRTLDIQSPYVVLDESTRAALDAARARGVRVRLLTEGDRTDARPVKDASRHAYQALLDTGWAIHEYEPTMMHVKVLVVDGTWSVIGSANLDNRSLELNDELTLAVAEPALAAELTRDFERDLGRTRRLEAGPWSRRPFEQKVREWFWHLFGELF